MANVEPNGINSAPGGSRVSLLALSMANEGPAQNVTADLLQLNAPLGPNVVFATGYAGNDVVEPSILYDVTAPFFADSSGAGGYEYVMCLAGYSGSNALYENPNLWVSHDGDTWVYVVFAGGIGTPTAGYGGVLTPIVPSAVQGDGLLSDPCICRGPDGTYFIVFNQALVATGSGGTGTGGKNWSVKIISAGSLAGPWSAPVSVVTSVLASERLGTPAPFWDGVKWHIYGIDYANLTATFVVHYTCAAQDLTQTWVKQTAPTISVPAAYSSQVWWHLNAIRFGHHHLLLIQDDPSGGSTSGNLWGVWSKDGGTTWTVPDRPFMAGNAFYRPTAIASNRGSDIGLDVYYGVVGGGNWQIHRTFASFTVGGLTRYGGLTSGGLAINALATIAARLPTAPYVFGDAVARVDSAVTPSPADSGQSYTVSAGTFGVLGKQLYVVAAGNARAALTLTGVADGVYACEFSGYDVAAQQWFIARYVDASNYIRVGFNAAGFWVLQNIVVGAVSQSQQFTVTPAAGDVVALVCSAQTITTYVNGNQLGRQTGWTANQAGSGVGVQSSGVSGVRFRNISVRPLVLGA